MSKYEVSTQELNRAVSLLTEKSCSLKTKIAELLALQENLSTQWSGDASKAFSESFRSDHSQWVRFTQVLDNYIQTLLQISKLYDNTEARNLEIIKSRSKSYPFSTTFQSGGIYQPTYINALYAAPSILFELDRKEYKYD